MIRTKDLQTIVVDITAKESGYKDVEDLANGVVESVEKLSAIDDVALSYPFVFSPTEHKDFRVLEDGWQIFQPEIEFSKLIHAADSEWRISYVNKDFSVMSS